MNRNKSISKENYITCAHDIIASEGVSAITIRRLAGELNCNSANLYRYFEDTDELVLYASVRVFRDYLHEVSELVGTIPDVLEQHLKVWECFARHTFANPIAFNNMLWGKHSDKLEYILRDYYHLFDDELEGFDQDMQDVFLSGNFDYRDYLMLSRCVRAGLINDTQARFLNTLSMHLYKGFLKELLDNPANNPEECKTAFISCLTEMFQMVMKK